MGLCLLGTIALIPMWLQRGCGNSIELEAQIVVEKLTAMACHEAVAGTVEIINEENLPPIKLQDPDSPAPIFIANHCSQLDVSAVYYALRRFKWIAKKSVRYIPGPGNIMSLGGHIFIQRSGKRGSSVSNLYQLSNEAIQAGIPMMFFPQGTRRMTTKLPFKDGAFKIAIDNECVLVPISIHVPPNAWNSYYPLNLLWGGKMGPENKVIMTVHAPIQVNKDTELKPLKEKCQEIIYSALPALYHGNDGADKKTK